jgi:hypothetical protein
MRKTFVLEVYDQDAAENLQLDELKVAYAFQQVVATQIAGDGYDIPRSLTNSIKNCKRELDHKIAADLERQLEAAKARRAALATRDEVRKSLDDEIAALEARVNPTAKAATA